MLRWFLTLYTTHLHRLTDCWAMNIGRSLNARLDFDRCRCLLRWPRGWRWFHWDCLLLVNDRRF